MRGDRRSGMARRSRCRETADAPSLGQVTRDLEHQDHQREVDDRSGQDGNGRSQRNDAVGLIERGHHRDAVFWMAATYSRCQWVLHHDAPTDVQEGYDPGYRHLLADLGITSYADMLRRGEQVREFLPRLWDVAEGIMGNR